VQRHGFLEMDCQRVINVVMSPGLDRSPFWSTYLEIKDLLRLYPDLELRKVDRLSNRMPHGLTQLEKGEAKDNSIAGCWYKSSVISSIVNLELVCKIVNYKNHYRKHKLLRRPQAVGIGENAIGVRLCRRQPSA
jgi:hypothetical protein